MKRPKALVVIAERCKGCLSCEVACSSRSGEYNPSRARLYVVRDEWIGLNVPIVCNHCGLCMDACLRKAIHVDEATHAVTVNEEVCNGCGSCIDKCPLGLIRLNSEDGKAVKCDLCNGNPKCVEYCPHNALLYDDIDAFLVKKRNSLLVVHKEKFIEEKKLAALLRRLYPYILDIKYPTLPSQ